VIALSDFFEFDPSVDFADFQAVQHCDSIRKSGAVAGSVGAGDEVVRFLHIAGHSDFCSAVAIDLRDSVGKRRGIERRDLALPGKRALKVWPIQLLDSRRYSMRFVPEGQTVTWFERHDLLGSQTIPTPDGRPNVHLALDEGHRERIRLLRTLGETD